MSTPPDPLSLPPTFSPHPDNLPPPPLSATEVRVHNTSLPLVRPVPVHASRRAAHEEVSAEQAAYDLLLDAWFKDPNLTGKKQIARRKIREVVRCGLDTLDLSGLGINIMPPLGALSPHLRILNLSDNAFTYIPPEIGELTHLEMLVLQGNHLTELPSELGNLSHLQVLKASHNNLNSIPSTLGRLRQLIHLELNNNALVYLPSSLGELSDLIVLDLSHNTLTYLPPESGNLLKLKTLRIWNNKQLSSLPFTLGSIPGLIYIDTENTLIHQDLASAILNQCRAQRDLEAVVNLPDLLQAWHVAARHPEEAYPDVECFDAAEKIVIVEWLNRLERTHDFQSHQQVLASAVLDMLNTAIADPNNFRMFFLLHLKENNADCEDRAGMSINSLYVGWRLANLPPASTLAQKLELLVAGAKTSALHYAIDQHILRWQRAHHAPPPAESVEAHLLCETELRVPLNLLSLIHDMHHKDFAEKLMAVLDLHLQDLVSVVTKTYLDHITTLTSFRELVQQQPTFQSSLATMQEPFTKQREVLEAQLEEFIEIAKAKGVEAPEQDERVLDCQVQLNELMKKKDKAETDLMKQWFLSVYQPAS